LFPSCPEPTDGDPEEPVEQAYSWLRVPTLEHCQLLAQGEILAEEAPARPHEANQRSEAQCNELKQG
jgi:hypothetical protein